MYNFLECFSNVNEKGFVCLDVEYLGVIVYVEIIEVFVDVMNFRLFVDGVICF